MADEPQQQKGLSAEEQLQVRKLVDDQFKTYLEHYKSTLNWTAVAIGVLATMFGIKGCVDVQSIAKDLAGKAVERELAATNTSNDVVQYGLKVRALYQQALIESFQIGVEARRCALSRADVDSLLDIARDKTQPYMRWSSAITILCNSQCVKDRTVVDLALTGVIDLAKGESKGTEWIKEEASHRSEILVALQRAGIGGETVLRLSELSSLPSLPKNMRRLALQALVSDTSAVGLPAFEQVLRNASYLAEGKRSTEDDDIEGTAALGVARIEPTSPYLSHWLERKTKQPQSARETFRLLSVCWHISYGNESVYPRERQGPLVAKKVEVCKSVLTATIAAGYSLVPEVRLGTPSQERPLELSELVWSVGNGASSLPFPLSGPLAVIPRAALEQLFETEVHERAPQIAKVGAILKASGAVAESPVLFRCHIKSPQRAVLTSAGDAGSPAMTLQDVDVGLHLPTGAVDEVHVVWRDVHSVQHDERLESLPLGCDSARLGIWRYSDGNQFQSYRNREL